MESMIVSQVRAVWPLVTLGDNSGPLARMEEALSALGHHIEGLSRRAMGPGGRAMLLHDPGGATATSASARLLPYLER
jgi:hypothetical protein